MTPDHLIDVIECDALFSQSGSRPVATFPTWKRALDIIGGGFLLACGLPLLLVAAAAIKAADGGPILFWQKRVGRWGYVFWFPKLRSMCVGAPELQDALRDQNDHGESITFKMRQDPRVTRIGRLLRMLSLDELPQLWCVLTGTMSLVGPRPPLPTEVLRYTPAQFQRLAVKPGITGLWQVSGRSNIPFEDQVSLDLEYAQRQSLQTDLFILVRTIPAVISCRGAW
jgi:lipopolysaccharide/colanic/teichoic acid biosynthesis glycosyltransferase